MKNDNAARNLVVMITHGPEDERASAGLTIANGGITSGLQVSIFLTASGVDIARKRASDLVHVKPFEPLAESLRSFTERGGTVWACTPCANSRGYTKDDIVDGVTIAGASGMHALIQAGAATLSF